MSLGAGNLHPRRDDGSEVNATFEVQPIGVFDIVYHHKAGSRTSPRSVNPDYHEGLELLLRRLACVQASILGISVDSTVALELPEDERELRIPFPRRLDASTDLVGLRLMITRAQKEIARRSDAQPGGGNDQKRIRMTVAVDAVDGVSALERLLVSGLKKSTHTAVKRVRTALPTVKNLFDAGWITPGMTLEGSKGTRSWRVRVLTDGQVLLADSNTVHRLGTLTNELSGHAENSMRMWSVVEADRLVPLWQLRDEFARTSDWHRR